MNITLDDEDRRDMAVAALRGLSELVNDLGEMAGIDPRHFGALLAMVTDKVDEAFPTTRRPRATNDE